MQIANNEITVYAIEILKHGKYMWNKILKLFYVYFMKLDIFANFTGKILHPSKRSLSQIE